MTNRLKDKEADQVNLRRRDHSNNLLAENLGNLVKEEGKVNSSLKQVRHYCRYLEQGKHVVNTE